MKSLRRVPWPVYLFFMFWVAYFTAFWSRAITFSKTGGLMAGHVNIWGDWAAHFTMGSALAYRNLFLLESPFLIQQRFSYPFLSNWISALLIRAGVPFWDAFILPSFLLSITIVIVLVLFYRQVFSSWKVALLSTTLFLCNGGIGWYYFFKDVAASAQPFWTLVNPPHEYTRLDEQQIKWISVIDSMIIPQRAFVLGFPLAVLSLLLVLRARREDTVRLRLMLSSLAGVIIGILPLAHTHSFLAVGIILATWTLSWTVQDGLKLSSKKKPVRLFFEKNWTWILTGCLSLVIALPLYIYFFSHQVGNFIQWYPGWLAKEFKVGWLVFWFKNWTVIPVLALVGWLSLVKKHKLAPFLFFFPFFLLFILTNLFLFQPFAWDNTKLIIWASLGFSGLTGYVLVQLWEKLAKKKALLRIFVILLFFFVAGSGMIDAYRILRVNLHKYEMYSAEELGLSEWVKANTPASSVWLTGNQHNHFLFNLTGRQTIMAYPGWVWTYGYNISEPSSDISTMYTQPGSRAIIAKYGLDYAVVGPIERRDLRANTALFDVLYPVVHRTRNYTIYKIR